MKQVLCVGSYDDLKALVAGQTKTVDVRLTDCEVCDKVDSGMQQLVPYVVFYNMNVEAGKLKFVQYLRPDQAQEGTEERVAGTSSIGFGSPITEQADLVFSETVINKAGETSLRMTLQDVVETAIKAGVRDVQTTLNLDVFGEIGAAVDYSQISFFKSEAPGDENIIRAGVAIPVQVTEEQFNAIKETCTVNPEEIVKIDTLGINIALIVEQMDVTPTIQQVIAELVGKYNLEAWSTMMFNYIARKEIHEFLSDISYNDIVALVHGKRAAMAQFEAEQLEQRRQESEAQTAAGQTNEVNGAAVLDATTEVEELQTGGIDVETRDDAVEETDADQSKEG